MDPMEIKEIDHWQHLRFLKQAVADAQLLYARSLSIVQVSQELLREMDDLSRTNARLLSQTITRAGASAKAPD